MKKNNIFTLSFICIFLCFIMALTYKSYFSGRLDTPATCTLATLHKDTVQTTLSASQPELTQEFLCTVPELKKLRIKCIASTIHADSRMIITLTDPETSQSITKKKKVSALFKKKKTKYVNLSLKDTFSDTENKTFILSIVLLDPQDTAIDITCNSKPGIVESFNQDPNNKTNIIYDLSYSDCRFLKGLVFVLFLSLLSFTILCYYLLIVRQYSIDKCFIPIALFLGIIFNFVFMSHGIPDEPDHIDTAYYYSNKMMFSSGNDTDNTIYKRKCDIIMKDMLVNGLESNSYYQLKSHFFEIPDDTELVEVSYVNTGHIVPDIVYIPTAIGISVGRLLHLSSLLTFFLGRLCNLVFFIILIYLSLQIIPFGKQVLGAVMLLPITMQQAASASYDPFITGIITLFLSLCFSLTYNPKIYKRQLAALAILMLLIVFTKGGVYAPLCLLVLLIIKKHYQPKRGFRKSTLLKVGAGLAGLVLLFGIFLWKNSSVLLSIFAPAAASEAVDYSATTYSLSYFYRHPAHIFYIFWRTLLTSTDDHLRSLLGGRLSWLDIKINWIFLIVLFICLLLLAHTTQDSFKGGVKTRLLIAGSCGISIFLVMLSMLFAYTTMDYDHIVGLQGRYYLALFCPLLLITKNSMIKVSQQQAQKILLTILLTNMLVIINAIVLI